VNTWSVEGFVAEGLQPSELGWGTHEKTMPPGAARHGFGCDAAIYLKQPEPERGCVRGRRPRRRSMVHDHA
jgi:homospermidine synthase